MKRRKYSQGYKDRLDESLGMRERGRHEQSLTSRRHESEGMRERGRHEQSLTSRRHESEGMKKYHSSSGGVRDKYPRKYRKKA